jgi:hypothetical protein
MKSLMDGKVDGILGFYSFSYIGSMLLGETKSYFSDPIVLVISPGEPLSAFQKLFLPFDVLAWILIVIVIVGAILLVLFVTNSTINCFKTLIESHTGDPYMNMLIAITGQSQRRLPKANFARWMLMMFLVYFFIIRTMYATQLFNIMQKPQFEKDNEYISELIENKFTFYVNDNMDRAVENFMLSER